MFTLKPYSRNTIRIVAVGAAASLGLLAATSQAASLTWDPGNTPLTPSGGSGNFNNSDPNFSNGTTDQPASSSDDTIFAATGGAVNVTAPTTVQSLTLSPSSGIYTLSGSPVTLGGTNTTILTQTAGANAIGSLRLGNQGNSATAVLDIQPGTLVVNAMTAGNYGLYQKTGGGTLIVGSLSETNAGYVNYNLLVSGGTVVLNGSNNHWGNTAGNSNGVSGGVAAGARLAGNSVNQWTAESFFNIDGELAPGNNSSSFGSVGTFAFTGATYSHNVNVHFGSTSILDLDLFSPDSGPNVFDGNHDVYKMTAGSYGGSLVFDLGSVIRVGGSPTPGVYHIVQMVSSDAAGFSQSNHMPVTDGGLTVDVANSVPGFTYQVVDLPNNAGIDLIVTAAGPIAPEPASLSVLGLGAGLLVARKRRNA